MKIIMIKTKTLNTNYAQYIKVYTDGPKTGNGKVEIAFIIK